MSVDLIRRLFALGALLFGLSALTGGLVAAVFTGKIEGEPGFMLAAHMNAILGCFWLICVAVSFERLVLSAGQKLLLFRATVLAAYANWAVTLAKSLLKVQGIDFTGEPRNDAIFGVLTLTVVIPTFVSSGLWIFGLWKEEPS